MFGEVVIAASCHVGKRDERNPQESTKWHWLAKSVILIK